MTRRARKRERRADVDPEPMAAALQRYTDKQGLSGDLALARIREHWSDVVGPILASRARADRLSTDGALTISCDHGATANELAMLTDAVKHRASEVARVPVKQVDIRVRRLRG